MTEPEEEPTPIPTPYELARNLRSDLDGFITGDRPVFYHYFVGSEGNSVDEKEFIISLGLDEAKLSISPAPLCVYHDSVTGVQLYRWPSFYQDGSIAGQNYAASRDETGPINSTI